MPTRDVEEQFSAVAANYRTSRRHAAGADLPRLIALAGVRAGDRVLDLATGAGHAALALAGPCVGIVALDLTHAMLLQARCLCGDRVHLVRGSAEELPFPTASFDVVTCRLAAHHFSAPDRFVAEAARVLHPGGRLLIDDSMPPEDAGLDDFMNCFERLRDPSHVRSRRPSEWCRLLTAHGLRVEHVEPLRCEPSPFEEWTARAGMTEAAASELTRCLLAAPLAVRRVFGIDMNAGRVLAAGPTLAIVLARKADR